MTIRQMKLAKNIGKSRTLQEAAEKAGYAPSTARQQQSITDTKGWQEILDMALPDEDLLEVHKKLLKHDEWQANNAGLDKAYKIKNKYPKEGGVNINEAKILIMPAELIEKYDLPSNTSDGSQ